MKLSLQLVVYDRPHNYLVIKQATMNIEIFQPQIRMILREQYFWKLYRPTLIQCFFWIIIPINLILSSLFGVVVSIFARKRPTVRIAVEKVSSIRLNISTFFAKTEQKMKTYLSFQQTSFDWLDNSICSTSR